MVVAVMAAGCDCRSQSTRRSRAAQARRLLECNPDVHFPRTRPHHDVTLAGRRLTSPAPERLRVEAVRGPEMTYRGPAFEANRRFAGDAAASADRTSSGGAGRRTTLDIEPAGAPRPTNAIPAT
jgi:hypothetical protein